MRNQPGQELIVPAPTRYRGLQVRTLTMPRPGHRCSRFRASCSWFSLEDPRLLLPPAGEGRSSVSCDQVRAVIGSSWFLLLRPGYPQPYGFHIAESSASICSRCRNQYTPIKDPLVAPGLRAAGSEPRSLVEVAGFEPASSTHPFQHLDSVSAALRPSHCRPTKARLCSWLRWVDLNHRPPGYEPAELPTAPHRTFKCDD